MPDQIDQLARILNAGERSGIYTCIQDLLTVGVVRERFKPQDAFPTRQDVTHFILTWLKHIGVSADRCRDWIIRYSVQELSAISSSSPSRIRHSTKSLIKYVFGSQEVSFECGCEQNRLKAACRPDCPVYGEMKARHASRERQLKEAVNFVHPLPVSDPQAMLQVKERYKEQFEKAMQTVRQMLGRVDSLKEMVKYLNEQGYKTRTGRPWTVSILSNELKKHDLRLLRKQKESILNFR